jgi:hypothetical protein
VSIYTPAYSPEDPIDLRRFVDEELSKIQEAVDINHWEHSHALVTASTYDLGSEPYVFADATAADQVFYLPAPPDEMILNVKKIDSTSNTVTLDAGSNTIDGSNTIVITCQYASVTVYWDKTSTSWWIV